jgi:hypothetical protein
VPLLEASPGNLSASAIVIGTHKLALLARAMCHGAVFVQAGSDDVHFINPVANDICKFEFLKKQIWQHESPGENRVLPSVTHFFQTRSTVMIIDVRWSV